MTTSLPAQPASSAINQRFYCYVSFPFKCVNPLAKLIAPIINKIIPLTCPITRFKQHSSSVWIFEALERLMQTTAYRNITITDICKEAKIGRVTFYRHYDTIDDVLRKKCDEKFDGLIAYLFEYKTINSDEATFFQKPFLRYWYANSSILYLLFRSDRLPILGDSLDNMLSKIKADIKLGHPSSKYSNYFFALRSSIPIAVLAEWVKHDMNIPPDELSDALFTQLKEVIKFNQMGV